MSTAGAFVQRAAGRSRAAGKRDHIPVILCVDVRGPVETLVRLVAASCTVRQAMSAAEVEDAGLVRPDAVVYDVTGPSARAVAEALPDVPRIAVLPPGASESEGLGNELHLREPFGAPALTAALTTALGRPLPGSDVQRTTEGDISRTFAIGRIVAVAIGAVLELTVPPVGAGRALVLASAFGYTGLRTMRIQAAGIAVMVDVAVAVSLVFGTGFAESPYLLFAVVVAVEAGYRFGLRIGVPAAALVGAALLAGTVPSIEPGEPAATPILVSFALVPIAAGAGALAARVRSHAGDEGQRVLAEMNRTLERLAHQAQILPGGLEVGTVADQALVEMREGWQADAGMVLVGEGDLLRVVGAFGVPEPIPTALRRDDAWWEEIVAGGSKAREAENLPPTFRRALEHERVWLVPLRRGSADVGLMLMAGSGTNLRDTRRTAKFLDELAVETSLALDNARLFALVRELSVDRERRRIARDLHDGVVQTLVHVGFELDLLAREAARTAPDESAGISSDARRLRSVIEGSVRDVRATISDLRTGRAAEGLVSALREHLRDLRVTEGPRMTLDADDYDQLPPEAEHELFRVAQEAISNAVQHAGASSIRVGLRSASDGTALLLIEDDGIGMPNGYGSTGEYRGVGMRSMHERAALLGARLNVESKAGKGTRITIEVPRSRT